MATKSPAFQMYPDQFMGGKPGLMEPLETHTYLWLLFLDWNQNGFDFDEKTLAKWCRITRGQFRKAWRAVGENFLPGEDGKLRNPRLQREREKQLTYSQSMSENGKKGGRPRKPRESRGLAAVKPEESIPVSYTPVTTKTTTPRAKREKPVENWVSRLAAFFREKGGTVSEGHLGRALKGAHEKYGEDVLRAAMSHWLAERKQHGWMCAFGKFAQDYVRWCEDVLALRQSVDSGVDYWDNEVLQRLTRPTMVA